MLKILIVEDDADKLRRVLACIKGLSEGKSFDIVNARDAITAKALIREHKYDLLILDIVLPERSEELPSAKGGIALLNEINDRDIYQKPGHVIGLTAYSDALEAASSSFARDLWHVIQYEVTSESWLEKLGRKVRYLAHVPATSAVQEFKTHLCIVTALEDPELTAVRQIPWNWTQCTYPEDGTVYYRGHFYHQNEIFEIVTASAARMGMTATAILTMKMITAFRPKYVAMAGILAGIRGVCDLGDIVIADFTWDYGSGKHQVKNGLSNFSPAPYQVSLSPFLRGRLSAMSQNRALLDGISRSWLGNAPKTILKMHLGPVASGSSVLQDHNFVEMIQQQHRKVIGIEMETYGLFEAAEECTFPQPKAFSMKSVCDFADEEKADDSRKYAAFTSAAALRIFVENELTGHSPTY